MEIGILKPVEISEEFESVRLVEKNIIEALKNDNIDRIGICGPVGVGKTRMAIRIGEAMKREELLKVVMMVTVGPNPDLNRIAHGICSCLGVELDEGDFVARANELLSGLIIKGRVMIVLDDVRNILNLEKIGIPLQEHKRSFKVMITSRSRDLCLSMGCHKIFSLPTLTRGYSNPLKGKGKVGDSVDQAYAGARSLPEMSQEEPNTRAEQFIAKFRKQLLQQRLDPIELYKEMSQKVTSVSLPPRGGEIKQLSKELVSVDPTGGSKSEIYNDSGSNNNVHGISSILMLLAKTLIQHLYILRPMDLLAEMGEVIEDDEIEGSSRSHLALSIQDSGSESDLDFLDDMSEKSFYSASSQNVIRETMADGDTMLGDFSEVVNADGGWDGDTLLSDFSVEVNADGGLTEEINNEAKLEVPTDSILDDTRYLKDFILFCSVFPSPYEFTKDVLVWQWVAGESMDLREDEIMEEVCCKCFDTLLSMDYIEASGYDHFSDQMMYKIGDKMTTFLQNQLLEPKFHKYLNGKQTDVAKVEHLTLAFEQIDGMKIEMLKQYSNLHTLIVHHCCGFRLNHLPSDIFLHFKALKILNFSYTNIVELPSSVENLKELRFLDMSQTPISWLPETICCCSSLQTLKLDGCLSLRGLPKCTSKLINLRHLVLDVARQMQSMPVGIRKLHKLRTLSAFLVGEDDGCRIGELKDMNKLSGSFRLLYLENVMSKEEAEEACLFDKQDLKKIELQWSDLRDEKDCNEEEILEYLRPHFAIQELKILFYSGGVFPSWISNPMFGQLDKMTLFRCRYCCSLPSLGELPSLRHLIVIENNEVTEIDSIFCKKQTNKHLVAFPKLEKLSFETMSKLERWIGLEKGDFPSLRHLIIEDCPKFVGLPFLSGLNSLLHLEIGHCPELSCLPEDGLPSNLESLMIRHCPKLAERCCNERCEEWPKVARVPGFYIGNQKISP